ncbi:serine/threonine-protein phosphatase 4 regulatory subunit 1-like isoform X2 [Tamandua tetradactyla]|uniref:serine/threonine-protein phosphatase 4 regulatory subunit 1-like isoform X2 n=1 Tax=Tamandua tetradactyla TaxID=48850 RepID=UPI004053EA80
MPFFFTAVLYQGAVLVPKGHLAMSGDVDCHNLGGKVLLAASGMLLNILHYARQPPQQRIVQPRMSIVPNGLEDYSPDCNSMRVTTFLNIPGQDNLPPLTHLEKYAFSDNIFNRQIIARGLLSIFQDFSHSEEGFFTVMEVMLRLSEDAEPTVRMELMEQIPPIATFLRENRSNFPVVFSEYLLPIVVTYLTDPNIQVRKSSQEVLLILLEQNLVFQHDIENKVCPILLDLSAPDSDDEYKVEAVSVICKMASMLSKSTVERLLLPRFCELCGDGKLFQVRKVCATYFGDICHAVGQEAAEKFLIPKFFELCSDNVWGMRKACAECFMAVSYTASPEIRRVQLSPLFIRLISDPCRWVRQAAFQSLGPFISTFANPSRAGLYIQEDGTLSIRSPAHDLASSSPTQDSCGATSSACSRKPGAIEPDLPMEGMSAEASDFLHASSSSNGLMESQMEDSTSARDELTRLSPEASTSSKLPDTDDFSISNHCGPDSWACPGSSENVFNNFLYWQIPLPDISQDLELLLSKEEGCSQPKTVPNSCVANTEIQKVLNSLQEHMLHDPDVQVQVQVLSAALRAAQLDSVNESESKSAEDLNAVSVSHPSSASGNQIILPASSSENELSVGRILQSTDPDEHRCGARGHLQTEQRHDLTPFEDTKSKLQDIIPQPLLDQYVSMTDPARAQTVHTDIAKHCAYSLPGVALTLGRQNWHCLKDTYETLASDVQLLHADKRREYLYQLQEFIVTDNSRNWRFRYELAEQLILILELYNSNDVYDYLMHIALKLCADKVSEVRWISLKLVVAILQKFYSNNESALGLNFINELIIQFRHCPKWVGRQAFAFICQSVVSEECIPVDQFVKHLLPSLLSLASDPVPNVRVLLAKALRQTLLKKAYFRNAGNPHLEVVEETVLALQSDRDQDVSFFATLEPKQLNITDTAVLGKQN